MWFQLKSWFIFMRWIPFNSVIFCVFSCFQTPNASHTQCFLNSHFKPLLLQWLIFCTFVFLFLFLFLPRDVAGHHWHIRPWFPCFPNPDTSLVILTKCRPSLVHTSQGRDRSQSKWNSLLRNNPQTPYTFCVCWHFNVCFSTQRAFLVLQPQKG